MPDTEELSSSVSSDQQSCSTAAPFVKLPGFWPDTPAYDQISDSEY
jgi:hypothetical protein